MSERFTISLDADLAAQFERWLVARGYSNRSEAIRDLLREHLDAERVSLAEAPHCIANLSYIYNHHQRDLAERLTAQQHEHHELCVSTMHAHLDHDDCLETVILRGPTAAVLEFADRVTAQAGVRHGKLNLVPVRMDRGGHHVHAHPHN